MSYGLCPGKPPEGKLDRGEGHEGGQGYGKVLEVLGDQRAGRIRADMTRGKDSGKICMRSQFLHTGLTGGPDGQCAV